MSLFNQRRDPLATGTIPAYGTSSQRKISKIKFTNMFYNRKTSGG